MRAWLVKARNDLDTARQIAGLPEGHLDAAGYHRQQAAEKAVKGFLAYNDHQLERTHDIERLVSLAGGYEPDFSRWVDVAITLTPYATAYRYPGEATASEPSRAECLAGSRPAVSIRSYTSPRRSSSNLRNVRAQAHHLGPWRRRSEVRVTKLNLESGSLSARVRYLRLVASPAKAYRLGQEVTASFARRLLEEGIVASDGSTGTPAVWRGQT